MTLSQLIALVEQAGYTSADTEFLYSLPGIKPDSDVIAAPFVFIPEEPPVKKDCIMIPDWLEDRREVGGYARIKAGVALNGGTTCHLQFINKSRKPGL